MNRLRKTPHLADLPTATRRAIQRLVRDSVPRLADFSLAHLAHRASVTCIACAHATRDGARLVRALGRAHLVQKSDDVSAVAQVLRTGQPVLRVAIRFDAQPVPLLVDPVADLHRRLAPCSALVVPIHGVDEILGAVSLCYSESGRRYTRRDIPTASKLAGEIGRLLSEPVPTNGTRRLRPAARHARQGAPIRRRVDSRD
jgi:hypothetical protein